MTDKSATFLELSALALVPPGSGVHTVHTGREKREAYQKKLYGLLATANHEAFADQVTTAWAHSLLDFDQIKGTRPVGVFGVCSDNGGGIQRGANWGPLFLRQELLKHFPSLGEFLKNTFDLGDVKVIPHFLHDKYLNQKTIEISREELFKSPRNAELKHLVPEHRRQELQSTLTVSPLSLTENWAAKFFSHFSQTSLLSFGGDHSVSYPLVKTWAESRLKQGKKIALIHFDAHTDLSESRLGVDLCFGTWARHVASYFPSADQFIQIGIRSTAHERNHWENLLPLTQIWGREVKSLGAQVISDQILQKLRRQKVDEIYVSFDVDALDSDLVNCTGTPEADGLDVQQCATILQAVAKEFNITAADVVELAPFVNQTPESLDQSKGLKASGEIAFELYKVLKK